MRHLLHIILALVVMVTFTTEAAAQGKSYVGYSDGQIATTTSGHMTTLGTANGIVDIAICLTKSMLAPYKGNKLIGVNYGMPTSQGLNSINVWVRSTLSGSNLATGKINYPSAKWNESTLNAPYTITGDEEQIWIGATYKNTSRLWTAVSFYGTSISNGCYVNEGNGWTNYASKGWGSLSLEAIIEGENIATRNLALLDVKTRQRTVQVGDPISVSGIIKNNASESAVNPVIRYSINGQSIGSYTYNGTIAFRQSGSFDFNIPTTAFTEAMSANVSLTLEWADGTADDAPADNVANFNVELAKEVFVRRMVVEEHTGAGCGWCPRGIVGLKEMKARYGDNFIGIGIHSAAQGPDPYVVGDYNSFIGGYTDGLPSSTINRSGSPVDPSYTNLASHYQSMNAQADADIALEATYSTDGKINFKSYSRFAFNESNADYRVAYVVLENQLLIEQTNYYSSGSVMGGFEKLGNPTMTLIDDVARGIYPSPAGNKGSLPANIVKGETYEYSLSVKPVFKEGKNVEVVALLIDGKTGEIVNAVKTGNIVGLTSGTPVDPVDPGTDPGTDPVDPIIPLSHTFSPKAGATVSTMEHVIITFAGTESAEMTTAGNYNFFARSAGIEQVAVNSMPYLQADNGKVFKAIRVWKTNNPDYADLFSDNPGTSDDPFNNNEFQIDFEAVPAGHYTLVIPKNTFVYYDTEDFLCGTNEFTAAYTVTANSKTVYTDYRARFVPAEYSELSKWEVVTLYSTDDIYNYTNADLGYHYNTYYQHETRRPYVITPSGAEIEVKYADFLETTGVSSGESILQLTFPVSYVQGVYTLVIPDEYVVVCDATNRVFPFWGNGYSAPERRFTFFVGAAPEGIASPVATDAPAARYDLYGRRASNAYGISISGQRKEIR